MPRSKRENLIPPEPLVITLAKLKRGKVTPRYEAILEEGGTRFFYWSKTTGHSWVNGATGKDAPDAHRKLLHLTYEREEHKEWRRDGDIEIQTAIGSVGEHVKIASELIT